jgi:hypothetical protein
MNVTPEQLKKQKYDTLFMDMAERASHMPAHYTILTAENYVSDGYVLITSNINSSSILPLLHNQGEHRWVLWI